MNFSSKKKNRHNTQICKNITVYDFIFFDFFILTYLNSM